MCLFSGGIIGVVGVVWVLLCGVWVVMLWLGIVWLVIVWLVWGLMVVVIGGGWVMFIGIVIIGVLVWVCC